MNPSRRRLLLLERREGALPRMPWLLAEHFAARCTGCGACGTACPEAIVVSAPRALPAIDFARGGCTFCGRCADACPENLFTSRAAVPWTHRVTVEDDCLTLRDIVCQSCRDVCQPHAIAFTARRGAVSTPRLDPERCTACGACTAVCPAGAIAWTRREQAPGAERSRADAR